MNPSESAIERAIEGLRTSPGVFQRLVERFAEVELRDFFTGLTPQGRNSKSVAIGGWPDFIRGRNAGEATYSKDWRGHLENDLARAQTNAVNYFLFVAWAKSPNSMELDGRQTAASRTLGIPKERIRFVFKEELRRTLAQPRFAREWVEILGLPSACHPFVVVSEKIAAGEPAWGLFGRADSFLPTIEDYSSKRVYQPPLGSNVADRLSEDGWALVWGQGAAGKTTFALDVALNSPIGHTVTYYLSFYRVAEERSLSLETALDIITTRADRSVLFILDDIHLDERGASSLFAHWQKVNNGSRMLLLGRHKEPAPTANGQTSALSEMTSFQLRVDAAALHGAFRRLVPVAETSPEPPREVLDKWLSLFGGDLIAFGAAVQNRRDALANGDWSLKPIDAAAYVRRRYLRGLGERERQNLLRLASCYAHHEPLPSEAVQEGDLEVSETRGIVRFGVDRRRRRLSYTLVHEGVAKLILEAADPKPDIGAILSEIAVLVPYRGFNLARALEAEGRVETARAILEAIWTKSDWPAIGASLDTLDVDIELAIRLLRLAYTDMRDRVFAGINGAVSEIHSAPLSMVRRVLGTLNRRHHDIFLRLVDQMQTPAVLSGLRDRCEQDLPTLMYFLYPLEDEAAFRDLHNSWRSAIFPSSPSSSIPTWIERANLAGVSAMIRYLERRCPTWASIVTKLYETQDQLQRLANDCATALPLTVFQLLQTRLGPSLFPLINQATWAEHKLQSPSGILAILTYEQQLKGHPAYRVLLEPIAEAMVRSICRDPLPCRALPFSSLITIMPYFLGKERSYLVGFLDACGHHPDLDVRSLFALCERFLAAGGEKWAVHEEALSSSTLISSTLIEVLRSEVFQPDEAVFVMALWGLASQLGVDPGELSETPIDTDLLDLAFEYEIHFAVGNDRELTLMLFWLGVRGAALHGVPLPSRYIAALRPSSPILQCYRPPSPRMEAGRFAVLNWLTDANLAIL